MRRSKQVHAVLCRRLLAILAPLLRRLVKRGELMLIDAAGNRMTFGTPQDSPRVTVRLHRLDLPLRLLINPSLTLGEAYMKGEWTIEEGTLRDFLFVVSSNLTALDEAPLARLRAKLGARYDTVWLELHAVLALPGSAYHARLASGAWAWITVSVPASAMRRRSTVRTSKLFAT